MMEKQVLANMESGTVHVTDSAAERIAALAEQKGDPNLRLRVAVTGGGCSGFQYDMKLDGSEQASDIVFRHKNAEVIVDDVSIAYLKDSTIDYVQKLGSAAFEIKNPNATASCGCGSSFNVF